MEYCDFTESVKKEDGGPARILCCECGVGIEPNPANMCVTCLRNHVDITENIPKQAVIYFCRNCERYLQPPGEWVKCTLESRELLALCMKRIKNIKEVKLIDAGFIWTEPHSRRIKVKLTVQGEVLAGTVLQQTFVIEYTVNNQMCDACHRTEAKDFWTCLVQVRQRSENKKTFYYLEQLILKHKAHDHTLGIKQIHGGLDFYYSNENHARRLVEFINSQLPAKTTHSKRLISHDIHSNSYNYKFTFSVEIAPVSKDSLVCLNKKLQQQLGSISPICLVNNVAKNTIHLLDPTTAQLGELNSTVYFRNPFEAICNPKQLVEYIIMDIEVIYDKNKKSFPGQGTVSNKHILSDVWVVRASELGINDNPVHGKTHLGHLLKPGDSALGYNLKDANINNDEFDKLNQEKIPDFILIKKFYGDRTRRSNLRLWKIQHLSKEIADNGKNDRDYHEFLNDLEEDPQLREHVNIYRDQKKQIPVTTDELDNAGIPQITLEEMLDDLVLSDVEMAEEEMKE